MGKHLKLEKSGKHDHKPGWLAGMLHVLDYHHWRTKHLKKQGPICWGTPRTHSLVREPDEKQPFLDLKTSDSKSLAVTERPRNKLTREFSQKQVMEYVDILEILENEKISVSLMRDSADSSYRKQLQIKRNPTDLMKSGSFPLSGSSRERSLKPMTMEHKQTENWHASNGDSPVMTVKAPRFGLSDSYKEQNPAPSSSTSPSYDHKFSHAVMNGLREVMKWVKTVVKDRKHKRLRLDQTQQRGNLERGELHRVRRTNSINDSLNRYSQLIDHNFRRESRFHSKSLTISNEESTNTSRSNKPKFFRRVSSLSSLESLSSFLNELSHESSTCKVENRKSVDHDDHKFGTKKSALKETVDELMENRDIDASDFRQPLLLAKSVERSDEEGNEDIRERSCESLDRKAVQQEAHKALNINTARRAESLLSEGSDPTQSHTLDSLFEGHGKSDCYDNSEELVSEIKLYTQEEEDEEEDAYFCYVKKMLNLSGFLTNKELGEQWHSEDQPVSPSLFRNLKPCIHEQDELITSRLLFDLVNDAIVEAYNQSQTRFRQAISFTPIIYWVPKGKHLLDDVWERVQWNLYGASWAGRKDCSLDDLVARDLSKPTDEWMNVQSQAELLALELEELIYDEIMDEFVCVAS